MRADSDMRTRPSDPLLPWSSPATRCSPTSRRFAVTSEAKPRSSLAERLVWRKIMLAERVNRFCGIVLSILAGVALLSVLSGYMQPRQPDEGTAAHIFQLAVVALLPILVLFFATVDWKKPLRSTRLLAIPA